MRTEAELQTFLAQASVSPEVFELRPDYRALLIAIDGITARPSDANSENLLNHAETEATQALAESPVEELPHIAAWREAFIAFGAKPNRTRNSAEALIRRAATGLPRINRLTDIYNAFSVRYQIPFGGEDLDKYEGAPRLIRATGSENFDTVADGELIIEHPEVGEVVWCDDAGVTCRRWNWRQGKRTALSDESTAVLFIIDILGPIDDDVIGPMAHDLIYQIQDGGGPIVFAQRLISAKD